MSLDAKQFVAAVIRPTLRLMGDRYAGPSAQQLVLGTALAESDLRHLLQLEGGPALGLWQMEPATLTDNLAWLKNHPQTSAATLQFAFPGMNYAQQLSGNLFFACALCRVHYWRRTEPLPEPGNIEAQARYWKTYYNTRKGKGTIRGYVKAWDEADL